MRTLRICCFTLLVVGLASGAGVASGWRSIGNVNGITPLANGVELKAGPAAVRIVALSPAVIRVRYAPEGEFPRDQSFAVVANPEFPAPAARLEESATEVVLVTAEIAVHIERLPLRIVIRDHAGNVIVQDDPRFPVSWNGAAFKVWKSMPLDEHYFGLGDKAGSFDHRDQAYSMWDTDAYGWMASTNLLYKSIPFFMGIRQGRAYGIFLDNTYRTTFDFGRDNRDNYSFGADAGPLDYYFFYGPAAKRVVGQYTALTGRPPLPPLWALGYQQSRYSYYPEAQVREIASELRRRRIPADAIYLDIDFEDDHRSFTIDRKRFPNFEGMIRDLGQQGFKVVTIVDLHLKEQKGYRPYDEGLAGDHFVKNPDGTVYVGKVWPGPCVFPDFTRAATREWFGTLYRDFVEMGVRGFWNDMNEPAVFTYPEKTMPLDTVHRVDEGGVERKTDHREIHNVVGMQNVRATYDGLLRLKPSERPFVLTRAAYAGTQRYAASWTGDNQGTWDHLRLTVPTLLSLGISGYGLVGNDVGGFAGSAPPDLVTRWMEVGAFTPLYRNHTATEAKYKEPWVHGPEHEAIRRRFIEARYRLLPYFYATAEEMTRTGVPMMRPMFLEFPDPEVAGTDKEFMFGRNLLIAPKLTEMLDAYDVVFPQGVWYDYWTGQQVEGGKKLSVDPALDSMPVFVRGGAIVPLQPLVQSTAETPRGPLEVRVYPGPNCEGSVYLDDGETFSYRQGAYLRQNFTCETSPQGVRVRTGSPEGKYRPWWIQLQFEVVAAKAPSRVTIGGQATTDWRFDDAMKAVVLTVPAGAAKDVYIEF